MASDGNFTWSSSGRALDYTNWIYGAPDNWEQREHCVVLKSGEQEWNDVYCHLEYYFLCESVPTKTVPVEIIVKCEPQETDYDFRSIYTTINGYYIGTDNYLDDVYDV